MAPKNPSSSSISSSADSIQTAGEQIATRLAADTIENSDDSVERSESLKTLGGTRDENMKIALEVLNDAVVNDTDEKADVVEVKAQRSQHSYLLEKMLKSERREGVLEKRSKQAVIYTAFTELRIEELEKQLQKVKAALYKLPEDFQVPKSTTMHLVYRHILQRSSPAEFALTRAPRKILAKDKSALEVQIIAQTKAPAAYSKPGALHRHSTGLFRDTPNSYGSPNSLRIRSRPLPAKEENDSSVVFLQPFKLFVTHQEEIRQSMRELEEAVNQKNDEGSKQQKGRPKVEEEKTKGFKDEDLLLDLKLLIKFLDEDLRPTFDLLQKIKDGTATEIEYRDLWHLFKLGDIVVAQSNKLHAYRVVSFTGGRDPLIDRVKRDERSVPVDGFMIDCLRISYDGSNYVPQLDKFSIRTFIGHQPITSLPVYPLRFDKNSESLEKEFIAQGRRFLDVTIPPQSHKHLLGRTLDEPSHDIDAPVIIDMSMAFNSMPQWRPLRNKLVKDDITSADPRETHIPSLCGHNKYQEGCCGNDVAVKDLEMDDLNLANFLRANQHILGPRASEELAEEDLMLLPTNVHGFALRNRQWITLRVADLREVKFERALDDLMLPEQHKSSIQALVKVHENASSGVKTDLPTIGSSIDLVKGKGAALIILLHGAPGVGKTSTAECVADNTKRPLFPITCGDIGETAMEVERNLHYNFRLAHKWGCVLLLDEADVFLAKRNKTDLRRNAVTSVFLRSLEYYAGILFLTTNRVGSIDPAFKSRIHMSLFYPKLDLEATHKLYEVYIKRTRTEQERAKPAITFKIRDKEIMRFAKRHFREMEKEGLGTWNGRQIRNAFQVAIALVEHDGQQIKDGDPMPTLGEAQFRVVAESSKEFDRYLVSTLGAAESDIARREEWRADRFGSAGPTRAALPQSYESKQTGFPSDKAFETDEDTMSDEDDSSDESSSYEDVSKKRPTKKGKEAEKDKIENKEGKEFQEFQEYLKWKKARK
ncbi:hypothetical protein F5Y19DRAFT_473778 [Xylariaceae sp. FL1651]|nr:hypothetical protein F5Y19DRAFT_473778 [Xylariaceae sp. FL1651]